MYILYLKLLRSEYFTSTLLKFEIVVFRCHIKLIKDYNLEKVELWTQ